MILVVPGFTPVSLGSLLHRQVANLLQAVFLLMPTVTVPLALLALSTIPQQANATLFAAAIKLGMVPLARLQTSAHPRKTSWPPLFRNTPLMRITNPLALVQQMAAL